MLTLLSCFGGIITICAPSPPLSRSNSCLCGHQLSSRRCECSIRGVGEWGGREYLLFIFIFIYTFINIYVYLWLFIYIYIYLFAATSSPAVVVNVQSGEWASEGGREYLFYIFYIFWIWFLSKILSICPKYWDVTAVYTKIQKYEIPCIFIVKILHRGKCKME